ncbi:MAG: T9SS C-terminal target domain-containing protein, partial [Flavobacteriales bacterium]
KVLNQGQQQRLEMDLSNLRSGTYFLNISNDAGTITKPVVLNK